MKKFFIIILIFILTVNIGIAKENTVNNDKSADTIQYLNLNWWENYKDDILIEHLKNLYEKNYDLKNADLKVKENEKLVKIEFSSELPHLSFDGYIGRDFRSSVQKFGAMAIDSYSQSNFQLPLTASYEIDIWGKNRIKTKSAKQRLEIVKQAERAVYISLISDFVSNYYNLIKIDRLLEIQNELVNIQEDIVQKTKDKNLAGLCSVNEVLAEQKFLSVLTEEKNNLEDKQEVLVNVLNSYLAKNDGDFNRSHYSDIVLINNIPEQFNTDVIDYRPDFLQQEANIKMVGYDVRAARKELLPSFVIFGQLGLNAYRFGDLFKTSTQLANAGILPVYDIFSGGRKMAFLKLKKYQYDEALNNYQKIIVEDIKEVNTALSEFKVTKKNYYEASERADVQNKIYNLVYDKEKIGAASKLDVLYAKETELITEKDKISNTVNYIISTISLYKAVGGKNLFDLAPEDEEI